MCDSAGRGRIKRNHPTPDGFFLSLPRGGLNDVALRGALVLKIKEFFSFYLQVIITHLNLS